MKNINIEVMITANVNNFTLASIDLPVRARGRNQTVGK